MLEALWGEPEQRAKVVMCVQHTSGREIELDCRSYVGTAIQACALYGVKPMQLLPPHPMCWTCLSCCLGCVTCTYMSRSRILCLVPSLLTAQRGSVMWKDSSPDCAGTVWGRARQRMPATRTEFVSSLHRVQLMEHHQ